MIQFICLFLPAFVAIQIMLLLEKRDFKLIPLIVTYFNFVLIINTINVFLLVYLFGNGEFHINNDAFSNTFTFKYLFISMVIAIFIGVASEVLKKNIDINLKLKKYDKKVDKNV